VAFKDTERSPGILDIDNLENARIKKYLTGGQFAPNPRLGELVGNNY
jgi:hypothetical protein